MTIAGSDSGGGAGIQADLKTFSAHGVYGTCAVTAVTAQNTERVTGVQEVTPELVGLQIDAVAEDIGVDAVKTGMLSSSRIIRMVAAKLEEHGLENVVVDPVMIAKSGDRLLRSSAVKALRSQLLPRALLVTPNLPEAEALVGFSCEGLEGARMAAKRLVEMGARAVLVKGGHASGESATDVLYNGRRFRVFTARRIVSRNTHGTGCTFSAAIAAQLARGRGLESAVERAKEYLTKALARGVDVGHGHGPVDHFVGVRLPRDRL
jgi:hydroxymethylpyrimidine/phosphomethylpyrimidine kinase